MAATSAATWLEINQPSAAPPAVPLSPMRAPCSVKIASTLRGSAPMVRRMAIAGRFSFTTMTSVATILKAATATTSIRIMNIIVLVTWIERKKLA